jgi:hypothetical protein
VGLAEKPITVVVQQPQFLPWAGLWHKVVSADLYVIYAGVKFDQYDHQHRVTVDGHWLTVPVEKHSRNKLIKDVRISDIRWCRKAAVSLRQQVAGRRAPHRERLDSLLVGLEGWRGEWLLDLDNMLFCHMATALGLRFDLHIDLVDRSGMDKIVKLEACLAEHVGHRPFIYLAGAGGLDYMGYDSLAGPRQTRFQRMRPGVSPDSSAQSIALEDDPLATIRASACWMSKDGATYAWDGRPCRLEG